MKCNWCNRVNQIQAQVSSATMPIICKCGTKLGDINCDDLNKILVERDYYKKKFYERALTKRKG